MDVHSFSRPDQARARHLNLNLRVDFDRKILSGSAEIHFDRISGDELILDTRALEIQSVDHAEAWELGPAHPILGAPLRIRLGQGSGPVTVHYSTSAAASGLQWLDPPQTAGKRHPFLFTQSQAIHARSWIPCQDSPGVRVTYTARVFAPAPLRAVMAAVERDGVFHM